MSDASSKSKPSVFATISPIVVLVAICIVAGTLLGLVHGVTEPLARANVEAREQEIFRELFPTATSFEEVPCEVEGCEGVTMATDASGERVGYLVLTHAKGYGGPVNVVVAFGMDENVQGMVAMPTDETPGLGTRVSDASYINQYVGLTAELANEDSIDFISGATISSKAVYTAYNIAVQAYLEVR